MDETRESACTVAVVGAGAAGLSAALVLARARVAVRVFDHGRPRNAAAAHVRGFLTRDGASPADLLAAGREEVGRYGGEVVSGGAGQVLDGERLEDGFRLRCADGSAVRAQAVVVATGVVDELPAVPGLRALWGVDVHHCPHCHGWEVRGRRLVVLDTVGATASPPAAVHLAGLLRRFSDDVTVCPDGAAPALAATDRAGLAAQGVGVTDHPLASVVVEDGHLHGVVLADETTMPCESLFVTPRPRACDHVLQAFGCALDPATGLVATDAAGATSVPGVWAAGNVVHPRAQLIGAAGEGSAAGIAVTSWLLGRAARPGVEGDSAADAEARR